MTHNRAALARRLQTPPKPRPKPQTQTRSQPDAPVQIDPPAHRPMRPRVPESMQLPRQATRQRFEGVFADQREASDSQSDDLSRTPNCTASLHLLSPKAHSSAEQQLPFLAGKGGTRLISQVVHADEELAHHGDNQITALRR